MIRDMPENERPRERLEAYGAKSLSTYELVAILIASGSRRYSAIEVAKAIVNDTLELSDLEDKTISELATIRGVGKVKAITILAAIELGKRVLHSRVEKTSIQSPRDVYLLFADEFTGLKQETLNVLFLDLKANLIAKRQIFVGSLNQSLIHPREVFRYAVKYSAFQLILVHNHPSGDPEPSFQDIEVTKRFQEIGEILQIKLIDHVVIGRESYVSISEWMSRKQKKANSG